MARERVDTVTDITMSVKFTGICAFVPNGAGVRVVLANARDHPHVEPHIAAILVDTDNWVVSGRTESFKFDGRPAHLGGANMRAYELDGEDLRIATTGGLSQNRGPLITDCPTAGMGGDERSLRWMASMKDVRAGTMLKTAFNRTGTDVLALFDIKDGGLLDTDSHAFHNGNNKIAKWQHKEPGSGATTGTPRALAEVVRWAFPAKSSVTIISTKTGGNIELALVPLKEPLVWIVNQPKDDIIKNRQKPRRGPDDHFVHYYDLAFPVPEKKYIPHPLPEANDCGFIPGIGATNPRCPTAFFESVQP